MAVEIIPYQERWPGEFAKIAAVVRAGLGGLALRIDHIGSTSVPGLAAKDIIDLQVTVADLNNLVIEAFAAIGYRLPPGDHFRDHVVPGLSVPDSDWDKLYFREPDGQRRTHMHVRKLGRANQRYPLLFRDYLRAHPAAAEAYAELKRRLAACLADPADYPMVKDPAVDLIYLAAEEWAVQTGWRTGPPDA